MISFRRSVAKRFDPFYCRLKLLSGSKVSKSIQDILVTELPREFSYVFYFQFNQYDENCLLRASKASFHS